MCCGPRGPTAPSAPLCSQEQDKDSPRHRGPLGAGAAMSRRTGISPWGASAWECPPCPTLETKRSGRRELGAEGIQWQLVHLSARRERLPLTFMSRAELGQPAALGAREKRRGHAGTAGEVERKGTRPGPSLPMPGSGRGRRWPSPETHLQHPSANSSCRGRMKSSPREAGTHFRTNTRGSGPGESRCGSRAADLCPFRALQNLRLPHGAPA